LLRESGRPCESAGKRSQEARGLRRRSRGSGPRSSLASSASRFAARFRLADASLTSFARAIKLIIEVDGAIHARKLGADARRDLKLRRLGLRVVRVSAELVLRDLPAAVALVRTALRPRFAQRRFRDDTRGFMHSSLTVQRPPRLPPPAARSAEGASTVFGGGRRPAARGAGEERRVGAAFAEREGFEPFEQRRQQPQAARDLAHQRPEIWLEMLGSLSPLVP
jgi:very-short-patch-repair endonuclease